MVDLLIIKDHNYNTPTYQNKFTVYVIIETNINQIDRTFYITQLLNSIEWPI